MTEQTSPKNESKYKELLWRKLIWSRLINIIHFFLPEPIWSIPRLRMGCRQKNRCITLQCRCNECDGVSNHQPRDCLLSIYKGPDQRKHQSSASMAFVRGIHRWPVNSPHKRPVSRKMFPIDDVIMSCYGIYVFFREFPKFLNISQSRHDVCWRSRI